MRIPLSIVVSAVLVFVPISSALAKAGSNAEAHVAAAEAPQAKADGLVRTHVKTSMSYVTLEGEQREQIKRLLTRAYSKTGGKDRFLVVSDSTWGKKTIWKIRGDSRYNLALLLLQRCKPRGDLTVITGKHAERLLGASIYTEGEDGAQFTSTLSDYKFQCSEYQAERVPIISKEAKRWIGYGVVVVVAVGVCIGTGVCIPF